MDAQVLGIFTVPAQLETCFLSVAHDEDCLKSEVDRALHAATVTSGSV